MSCVRVLVCVIQHGFCSGCMAADPTAENTGIGSRSPGCTSVWLKSMVRASSLGGVPVFKRPWGSAKSFSRCARDSDGGSPARPPA